MEKLTIQELRDKGWIAFEYVRGSHAYGLNTEKSDKDIGGVFICPQETLMGLRSEYIDQVADETNDTVFYEFGRWVELLLKSNPTALESLFIPKHCIIGEVHPMVQHIIDNRDMFLPKECFKTLFGYAKSQIYKARGLNKKIVNPVTERKTVLDFSYVPYNQGSTNVEKWLKRNGLKQKYCALVPLPNMHNTYGLYYDFGTHIICEYGVDLRNNSELDKLSERLQDEKQLTEDDKLFIQSLNKYCEYDTIYEIVPSGYHGIVSENNESNDVRSESIPKGKQPIIIMSYNKDGYTSHCKDYHDYQDWVKKRNPVRYESNLGKNYDGKNMSHCMRLIRMGKELALGQGFNVERTYDRDYLLLIKNHGVEYDDIIAQAVKEQEEMDAAAETSTLPETPNMDEINRLLIEARTKFYK
jgi:hypothetical protein